MRFRSLTSTALVVGALGACRGDRDQPAPASEAAEAPAAPTSASFTATDYAFDGPAQIPAGSVVFRLTNKGTEPHHLVIVRIDSARTYDSLVAALSKPGPPPGWVKTVGGPNGVSAGQESNATVAMTPGEYALLCFVPTLAGAPHFAKGMARRLEVTLASGQAPPEPVADVVLTLNDYSFTFSAPLTRATRVIRVENAGPQMHEVVLARLVPGKTAEDLIKWEMGGRKGEAPGTFIGGMSPIDPGFTGSFDVSLEPGDYGLICFVPDAGDGKPHLAHGMMQQIKIE